MRDAPAYQEYASTMLANIKYRFMSLAERGLLDTLRRECWVNGGMPENPAMLAKVLSFDQSEIAAALPAVLPFFAIKDGLIVCPELDDLRDTYADRRERMAKGGKRSAENRKASTLQGASKQHSSGLQGRRQVKAKPNQSKAVAIEGVIPCDAYKEWMGDDAAADEYRKATDGE